MRAGLPREVGGSWGRAQEVWDVALEDVVGGMVGWDRAGSDDLRGLPQP